VKRRRLIVAALFTFTCTFSAVAKDETVTLLFTNDATI